MIQPWFQSKERQAALEVAAKAWVGTPFFAHASSRGHGVDCVQLVHALFVEIGAVPPLELPAYTLDHAHHSTRALLLRFLLDAPALRGRFVMVPLGGPRLPGDLFGLRSGRVDHHLACALQWGHVVHAVEKHGVITHDEGDATFAKRVLYVLRLMEEVR